MNRQLLMFNWNIIAGQPCADQSVCFWKNFLTCPTATSQQICFISDPHFTLPWHCSKWILICTNCSKLELSTGVTNSTGQFLLRTFDSIFAHFITSIQLIIIEFTTIFLFNAMPSIWVNILLMISPGSVQCSAFQKLLYQTCNYR